jgi:hypothetical protein
MMPKPPYLMADPEAAILLQYPIALCRDQMQNFQ